MSTATCIAANLPYSTFSSLQSCNDWVQQQGRRRQDAQAGTIATYDGSKCLRTRLGGQLYWDSCQNLDKNNNPDFLWELSGNKLGFISKTDNKTAFPGPTAFHYDGNAAFVDSTGKCLTYDSRKNAVIGQVCNSTNPDASTVVFHTDSNLIGFSANSN